MESNMSDGQSNQSGNSEIDKSKNCESGESNQQAVKSFINRFWRLAESHIPSPIEENSEAAKIRNHCKEEIKFWLEILGFIIGIAVAGIFLYQSIEMKRATIAAETQIKEMQKDRNLDERAWVGVTQTVLENSQQNSSNDDFRVEFKNTGRTPATDVCVWIVAGTFIFTNNWDITSNRTDWFRYSGMLAPDATGSINTTAYAIDYREVSAIQNQGLPYYVYGKIWYRDIFKVSHWTEFCFQIVWNPNFSALPITSHNTCDETQTNEPNK